MPCGEVVGLTVEAIFGWEAAVAEAAEGVVWGGATGVAWVEFSEACFGFVGLAISVVAAAVFLVPSSNLPPLGTAAATTEMGGASRSSSRAADGVPLEGLSKPPGLALSDRRLILGFSVAGLAKLNSAGSASGWVAGI